MTQPTEGKQQLHISARSLVEFIFREGDIDNRVGRLQSADAMLEGTRIHKKIQGRQGANYQAEVPLKLVLCDELYDLTLDGRADGIFTELDEDDRELVWIDEIKGMYRKLELIEEPSAVHKAQAMVYAYIFALQNNLQQIGVQMTYVNMDTEDIRYYRTLHSFEDLERWFLKLIQEYHKWAEFECKWKMTRQASIRELDFPYEYREGQKKLAQDVYRTILREKTLFLQAPTGSGKTLSTVYPAVKAVGQGLADRIFYLTAKTITGSIAREAFSLLAEKGYRGKVIQLTAKEKLCFCEEMECNPINCPYAKGHFDRVNDAVFELLGERDLFDRDTILEKAKEHWVCPFEFSLDLSSWCDDIICDYNYVFDPNVYLRRFFQEGVKGDYIFLVDEAHNLVDRSREMYSAALYKEDFLAIKKLMKNRSKPIERLLDKCNKLLLEYKRECENYQILDDIGNLQYSLLRLASEMDEFLQKPGDFAGRKDVLEFYFNLRNFISIYDLMDEKYVCYSELQEDGRFMLKLFCVDPSANLQACLDRGRSAVLFSATLLPIEYYKSLLSTRTDNYAIYAHSVFSKDQSLLLIGRDVSTRYTRRGDEEYQRIASYIMQAISCRKGNYMVFFPSYKFMEEVYEKCRLYDQDVTFLLQTQGMREEEREAFLKNFEEESDTTLAAFCVMGGIFGEGIDLKDDRLIGAIVVGTGLPQISNEREILKDYYSTHGKDGFDYAFRYPGMNKVLQAAGRVIRTTQDRGIILLLDERFLSPDYQYLYPREWEHRRFIARGEVTGLIRQFWDQQEER